MKQIANNNIQCISPQGKEYFVCFYWLREFIFLLKHTIVEREVEVVVKNALSVKDIVDVDGIITATESPSWDINKGKHRVKRIVPGKQMLTYIYWRELKEDLELGKEIVIKNWKFKVI